MYNPNKFLWVTTLFTSGTYLLNVRAKGYKEINKTLNVNIG